jgi:hypothetical protein
LFLKYKKTLSSNKYSAMNTKYFLIFFFTAFSFQVSSQDYDPIIKEGSFWDVIEDGGAGASCPYLYKYRLAGDFVYNGIT